MKTVSLSVQPATRQIFDELKDMGLVIPLAPARHELDLAPGEAVGRAVYPPSPAGYGGHMLLACTIRQAGFERFGWHAVAEEFLLLGPPDGGPLYLAIFRGLADDLQRKIRASSLEPADFTCIECAFNDPETSFFVMNAFVPHGECLENSHAKPASFYVTEPAETALFRPQWGEYVLKLNK